MTLFTLHLTIGDSHHHVDYDSIDACLADEHLATALDDPSIKATVVLWAGTLRLTGTPLQTSHELRVALVDNAKTILGRLL